MVKANSNWVRQSCDDLILHCDINHIIQKLDAVVPVLKNRQTSVCVSISFSRNIIRNLWQN